MGELFIAQRLFSSDFRMLACRADPDPGVPGCSKVRVTANGRVSLLCPRRVEAFLSPDAVSVAGIACLSYLDEVVWS